MMVVMGREERETGLLINGSKVLLMQDESRDLLYNIVPILLIIILYSILKIW